MSRYLLSPDQSIASRRIASWSLNVMDESASPNSGCNTLPPVRISLTQRSFFWLACLACHCLSWFGIGWPPAPGPRKPTFVFQYRSANNKWWSMAGPEQELRSETMSGGGAGGQDFSKSSEEYEPQPPPPPRYLTTKESRKTTAGHVSHPQSASHATMVYTEEQISWLLAYEEELYSNPNCGTSWASAAEAFNTRFGVGKTGNSLKKKVRAHYRALHWEEVVGKEESKGAN